MNHTDSCPNCGEPRTGHFCANCGQKDQPLRQSTLQFLRQAVTDYFGIDGRLWRTLGLLLFRPGQLTAEYLRGRRRRYLGPLRLYLSATVLFFFLLSVLDPAASLEQEIRGSLRDSTVTVDARIDDVQHRLDSLSTRFGQLQELSAGARYRLDSLRSAVLSDSLAGVLPDSATATALRERIAAAEEARENLRQWTSVSRKPQKRLEWQLSVLLTYPPDSTIRAADLIDAAELLYQGEAEGIEITGFGDAGPTRGPLARVTRARTRTELATALSDLARNILEQIPIVLFLMLPAFALLMKLAYVRRDWYYSEHLIFALHNHAVAFIGFIVIAVLVAIAGRPPWVTWTAAGVLALTIVYFFLAQKRVYGQGWGKTLAKYVLVFFAYWTVIMFFGFSLLVVLGSIFG